MSEKDFQELIEAITSHSANGVEIQSRIHVYSSRTADNNYLPNTQILNQQNRPSSLVSFSPTEVMAPAFSNNTIAAASKTFNILVQAISQTYYEIDDILITPQMLFSVEYSSAIEATSATLRAALNNSQEIISYFKLIVASICPKHHSHVFTIDFQNSYNFIETDGGIWSQNYLFWNYLTKKVLVFTLVALAEESSSSEEDSDNHNEDCTKNLPDNQIDNVFGDAKFFTFE
ncbi:hypothetical protein SS50377_23636 [Spironucleus salmonicida]|uniref:Repressor of RNA polymerase III transcription n=1 Tax=Spironucleus salmonicida TaxID=348837 RepID=V6LWJ3_9EUKA|nr:hypothetical protein SS50377_23636 [Spironucleus salmonicida]|eukprot:EST48618.1 hypothetical protein SS50377_11230 [Spironucleus salmonicida]